MRLVPACPPPFLCPYRANVASADERVYGKKEKLSIVVVDCVVVALLLLLLLLSATVASLSTFVGFRSLEFSLACGKTSFHFHAALSARAPLDFRLVY